jgi:dihydropteroate synthase
VINYTFERPKVRPSSPPVYADVVAEHLQFFRRRIHMAMAEGMARDQLMLDSGIAFGKSHDEDLVVLRRLSDFAVLGLPLLVAAPRKHFIGSVLGGPSEDRVEGTAAVIAMSIANAFEFMTCG